jgi:glutathione S-transferase
VIELYHAESCPYCAKVRLFMEKQSIPYVSKPVPLRGDSPLKAELKSIGGKTQVPYLVDPERGMKMYESDDIIDYLTEHYVSKNTSF